MNNRKLLIRKLAFIIILVFACIELIFIFEVILRSLSFLNYKNKYFLWPPYLSRIVKPVKGAFPGVEGDKNFFINSLGMRGDEMNNHNDYRILAIGGSTTESGMLDDSETWAAILQEKLNQVSELNIWVGNAGRRGSTLKENVLHIKYFVPQIPQVKTLILLAGINDFILALNKYHRSDLYPVQNEQESINNAFFIHPYTNVGYKGSAIWNLVKTLKIITIGRNKIEDHEGKADISWREKRKNASTILTQLPDLKSAIEEYTQNLNKIIDLSHEQSLRIILITQPTLWKQDLPQSEQDLLWFGCIENKDYLCYSPQALDDGMKKFNQKLLEVCDARQIECIDLASQLPKDTTIFYDDVHFNENGSKEVARVISDYLLIKDPFKKIRSIFD